MRADSGPYRISDVLDSVNGQLLNGRPRGDFLGITTDSRDVSPEDLFVPLVGDSFDGHDFLIPALEAGARGSLVCRDTNRDIHQLPPESVLIQVRDTYQALADLASSHRRIYPIPLIAVTGSSGKTTVKEMIAAVLGRSRRPLVSEANFNNLVGLPMTVLKLGPEHDLAVVEAGINVLGEMELLSKAASPDVAVITTVGPVHLEGLGHIENVAREKFKITSELKTHGVLIAPAENEYLTKIIASSDIRTISFGINKGDFRAENIEQKDFISFEMQSPLGKHRVSINSPGFHSAINALAAAAACYSVGISIDHILAGLQEFRPFKWRMDVRPLAKNRKLIYDCYNANPQSMAEALKTLKLMADSSTTLAVLGDMKELGDFSNGLHEDLGELVAKLNITKTIFVGAYSESFGKGFSKIENEKGALALCKDKQSAWLSIKDELDSYGTILVKGSRSMAMEEIADRIFESSAQT